MAQPLFRRHRIRKSSPGLWAANTVVHGSLIAVSNVAGDVSVNTEQPLYSLDPFPSQGTPVPVSGFSPGHLLDADHEAVDFVGRETQLREMESWRDSPSATSALLLHAPGGQGKTRLGAHFAQVCQERGWEVFVARPGHHPLAAGTRSSRSNASQVAGKLILVDYAERWNINLLLTLLAHGVRQRSVPRARVLMLSRSAGWWVGARHEAYRLGIATSALELPPLADDLDRGELFRTARDSFARHLGVADAERIVPPDGFDGEGFRSVLAIHMSALAAVEARSHGHDPPQTVADMSGYLIDRERSFWKSAAVGEDEMRRAVYTAVLAGPLPRPQGRGVLRRVSLASDVAVANKILDSHKVYYPTSVEAGVLEPLRPDRLAEDFLAYFTPGTEAGPMPRDPDDWASTDVPGLLIGGGEDLEPRRVRSALSFIVETANRWPNVTTGLLIPILSQRPELALAAGGAALATMAWLPDLDVPLLEAIEDRFPEGSDLDLDSGMAQVHKRLTQHRVARTADLEEQARLYDELGKRLHQARLFQEMAEAGREAVVRYRELVRSAPENFAFNFNFALALDNLAIAYAELGDPSQALLINQEAVALHRKRASSLQEGGLDPNLAGSLASLGNHLAAIGRPTEAIPAAQESVELYRRLSRVIPGLFASDLALALTNLGAQLWGAGQHVDAVEAAGEGVERYRPLAATHPDIYEPKLTVALDTLGTLLAQVGRADEALSAALEAEEIARRLCERSPVTFQAELALVLHNHGARLYEQGSSATALIKSEEAVSIHRELARFGTAKVKKRLAASLDQHSRHLAGVNAHEEAVRTSKEATDLYRGLFDADPDAHRSGLAMTLQNLGYLLWNMDELEECRSVSEQSVALYRQLAHESPTAAGEQLLTVLENLRNINERLGRLAEATAAAEESVAVQRRLGVPSGDLARSLRQLAADFSLQGRYEDALASCEEAVVLLRELSGTDAVSYQRDLAGVLAELAILLLSAERIGEARAAAEEAIAACGRALDADPAAFAGNLNPVPWMRQLLITASEQ
jgi:tetratricopeptide (TPR) repeat protein